MATNLQFIPGRKKDTENPVLNGYRYVIDKRRDGNCYWKCTDFRRGCRARITTVDGDQPTKYLASEAVSGMGLEARAKLGYQLSSLNRMVQRSRRQMSSTMPPCC